MALTAVPVGFVAGLFGIGGGLITVPFLYYIFGTLGIDQQYIMHLAVGTSFAIIIPTSVVSVLTHHKFNSVDFNVVKSYGVFVVVGVPPILPLAGFTVLTFTVLLFALGLPVVPPFCLMMGFLFIAFIAMISSFNLFFV